MYGPKENMSIGPGIHRLTRDWHCYRVLEVDRTAVIELNGFRILVEDAPNSDMEGVQAAIDRGRMLSMGIVEAASRIPPGFELRIGVGGFALRASMWQVGCTGALWYVTASSAAEFERLVVHRILSRWSTITASWGNQ